MLSANTINTIEEMPQGRFSPEASREGEGISLKTSIFIKQRISLLLIAAMLISIVAGIFASNGKPTFTDVPSSHWSYSYVEKAAKNGWVSGIGNGKFGVDNQVTYAEFSTMLVRAFLSEELEHYGGHAAFWYEPYCATIAAMGIDKGTRMYDGYSYVWSQPINRYEMAQLLNNILAYKEVELSYNAATVQAGIGDWNNVPSNYREALTAVVGAGMITGVDSKGTFNGNGLMTRGQAAVVMCRMFEVIKTGGSVTPVEPTEPAEPGASEGNLGQKLSSGATAAAGVLSSIGKDDAYPTYGNSDVVSPNGYFTGATEVEIGEAQLVYELLDMVNEIRVSEGLAPVKWADSDAAEEMVLLRAYELTIKYSHDRPNGGYAPGEVIMRGSPSAASAFSAWMKSPDHKTALMDTGNVYMTAAKCGNCWIISLFQNMDSIERYPASNYHHPVW